MTNNSLSERSPSPEFLDLDQEIPTSMPVLERWVRSYTGARPLAGVTALFIQHQLGNQVPMTRALLELGLPSDHIHWIDIPYTSNSKVRKAVEKLGIPKENFRVHKYRVTEPYGPYQRKRVQDMLSQIMSDPPQSLLVLDDGAYFLEAMATFKRRLPKVAVVEQTTRGLIKIDENASLRCCESEITVVNVARSKPKKTLEPPFIGRAVCAALYQKLRDRIEDIAGGRCLVLGFGAIGERVAEFLNSYIGCQQDRIYIHDQKVNRVKVARKQGYSVWNRADIQTKFTLVVGCSGRSSFSIGDYVYLENNAILASASSGSVELSRQDFIELADTSPLDDIEMSREELNEWNVHSDLCFRLLDQEALFLNGGFPINFNGQVNCVPSRYIQPTMTMMVAAAVQAVQSSHTGRIPLDSGFCHWVDKTFRDELGEEVSLLE